MKKVIVIGASGAIGKAFSDHCESQGMSVVRLSRPEIDLSSELSMTKAVEALKTEGYFDLIFVASGILHTPAIKPEKNIKQIDPENLHTLFQINAIAPILILKHFSSLLDPEKRTVFAVLSARAGSISDNQLGGWYGYRASKAALNMFLKTASIEYHRTMKNLIIAGLHPGAVDSNLSKPFQSNIPKDQLFSPAFSAQHLFQVIEKLKTEDSGNLFAWNGERIDF